MTKKILVVAHDAGLRTTRSELLSKAGYSVALSASNDDAMAQVANNWFDMVVVGRNSISSAKGLDERLREIYPNQLIVKIEQSGEVKSEFATRTTNSDPKKVLAAVRELFRDSAA